MSRSRSNSPHRSRGQAMVEFVIATFVLVPLFVGMTLIARYLDVRAATIQASRYAAFERATQLGSLSNTRLQDQMRERVFTLSDSPLRSTDGLSDAQAWRNENVLWRDHAAPARSLITAPRDVELRTTERAPPSAAAQATTRLVGIIDDVSRVSGSRFDVNTRAFHTAEVRVRLANLSSLPAPLNEMNLVLTERASVLADGWHAGNRSAVAQRSGALVPTRLFERFDAVLDPLREAFSVIEPSFDQLCLGHIDPDIVPEDRLSAAPRGARPLEASRC